jgi:hypothetical protein
MALNCPTVNSFANELTFGRGFTPASTRSGFIGTIQEYRRFSQASRITSASKAVSPNTTTSAPSGSGNSAIISAANSVCLR